MAADLLIEFLRTTASRAFCRRCLDEAFAWERNVQARIDQAVALTVSRLKWWRTAVPSAAITRPYSATVGSPPPESLRKSEANA